MFKKIRYLIEKNAEKDSGAMKNYISLMTEHIVVYTYIIKKEKERKEMNKYKHYSCSIQNPLKRSIQSSAINLWSRFQRGTILSPFPPPCSFK